MSYLSRPRFAFAGRFHADVPTVNNDPHHYDVDTFQASFQLPSSDYDNGSFNPGGTGSFRLMSCAVTGIEYADRTARSAASDPFLGTSLNEALPRAPAKIVDLDPEQQGVSEIWGLEVCFSAPDGTVGFWGRFKPTAVADLWNRFPGSTTEIADQSGMYQSILEHVDFLPGSHQSAILDELKKVSFDNGRRLSIRLVLDGTQLSDPGAGDFLSGRVVGVIGPYLPGEPLSFVGGLGSRRLRTVPQSPVGDAPALLTANTVTIDLGNALPTLSAGGPLRTALGIGDSAGPLQVSFLTDTPEDIPTSIDFTADDWYATTGGIAELQLDRPMPARAPIGIFASDGTPLLQEADNGEWVRADCFVFRLDALRRPANGSEAGFDTSASVEFYATRFGEPIPQDRISLRRDSSLMSQQAPPGAPPLGVPEGAVVLVGTEIDKGRESIAVKKGRGTLELSAQDLGVNVKADRRAIDGQLYGLTYALGECAPREGAITNPSLMLIVRVFPAINVPNNPTWLTDIRQILQPYANLYPAMAAVVPLDNYAELHRHRTRLQRVLRLPMTDPNHMPVSRDLSNSKRLILQKWLAEPKYLDPNRSSDGISELRLALQFGIELEHAAIPAYLTALFSIKPGTNQAIASALREIVQQEMMHMAWLANILSAIGGRPRLGHAGFVPRYPAAVPGGLVPGVTLRLRRCSIPLIRDTFMALERPEVVIEASGGIVLPTNPQEPSGFTIAWFYRQLEAALESVHPRPSIHALRPQLAEWPGDGKMSLRIGRISDASRALERIRIQGEGLSDTRPESSDSQIRPAIDGDGLLPLSHYFRLSEIVEGRRLIVAPHGGFAYHGDRIELDPDGVYPIVDDADPTMWTDGSKAAGLSARFSSLYQSLLVALHRVWNPAPSSGRARSSRDEGTSEADRMNDAMGIMSALKIVATELVQTDSGRGDGTTAGPCFQPPLVALRDYAPRDPLMRIKTGAARQADRRLRSAERRRSATT